VCSSVQGGSNSTTVHCGPDRKMSPHRSPKCRRTGLRDCRAKRPDVTPRASRSRSGSTRSFGTKRRMVRSRCSRVWWQ